MTTPNAYSTPGASVQKTNVMSIVALVLSIVGFTVIGILLGFVGLSQTRRSGEAGRGLAIAAVVIGFVELALVVGFVVVTVALGAASMSASY